MRSFELSLTLVALFATSYASNGQWMSKLTGGSLLLQKNVYVAPKANTINVGTVIWPPSGAIITKITVTDNTPGALAAYPRIDKAPQIVGYSYYGPGFDNVRVSLNSKQGGVINSTVAIYGHHA